MWTKTFENTGEDFSATYAAEKWLEENGYCVGAMQRNAPRGILKGESNFVIAKWRNLDDQDREELDGTMESGDPRTGTVTIILKEAPEGEAKP